MHTLPICRTVQPWTSAAGSADDRVKACEYGATKLSTIIYLMRCRRGIGNEREIRMIDASNNIESTACGFDAGVFHPLWVT